MSLDPLPRCRSMIPPTLIPFVGEELEHLVSPKVRPVPCSTYPDSSTGIECGRSGEVAFHWDTAGGSKGAKLEAGGDERGLARRRREHLTTAERRVFRQ